METILFAHFPNASVDFFEIILLSAHAENDILSGGKYVHQLEMLMNHTDLIAKSVFGRTNGNFFSVDINPALVGIINSRDHVHERCFSRSVLAEDGQNFALSDVHIHVFIRGYLSERFRDVFQLYCNGFIHSASRNL